MTDTPPLDLAALKRLSDEAWPPPWEKFGNTVTLKLKGGIVHTITLPGDHQTLAFIAVARTALPALIARLEQAEAELAVMRDQRRQISIIVRHMEYDGRAAPVLHYATQIRAVIDAALAVPTGGEMP